MINVNNVKAHDPVHLNLFELEFINWVDGKEHLLTEMAISIQIEDEATKKKRGTFKVRFNANVIDGKIEPYSTLQYFEKFKTVLRVFDKTGRVLFLSKFYDCKIENLEGLDYFDYTSDNIAEINVTFSYKYRIVETL